MREIIKQSQFRKDLKRVSRSGKHSVEYLLEVLSKLAKGQVLEQKHKDHPLVGEWADCRECHVKPDWLLIYRLEPKRLVLIRTGSHSELFG